MGVCEYRLSNPTSGPLVLCRAHSNLLLPSRPKCGCAGAGAVRCECGFCAVRQRGARTRASQPASQASGRAHGMASLVTGLNLAGRPKGGKLGKGR